MKSQNHSNSTQQIVNQAWSFSYALLWHNENFNETEIEFAKQLLTHYFSTSNNPKLRLVQFCERIIIAHIFQKEFSVHIEHPLQWLNLHYQYGYVSTKKVYDHFKKLREKIPALLFENRVLAEAFIQYTSKPTKENYQLGIEAIQHYHQDDYVQQYQNAILHFTINQ